MKILRLLASASVALALASLLAGGALADGTWKSTPGLLSASRSGHTATLLTDGKVLLVGGGPTTAEVFDPVSGTFKTTPDMGMALRDQTATLLANGKVLVAGGAGVSAELYDPTTGTWRMTGNMRVARARHTATLLPNGQVLVAGGGNASAELYNPTTGTWTATGNMSVSRTGHTAALLPNGKVLVAGGDTATLDPRTGVPGLNSAELYEPSTGSWKPTGSLAEGRQNHTMTLLGDGKVLVAGGGCGPDSYEGASCGENGNSGEVYDPAVGTWASSSGIMAANHTATLVGSGQVLVTGGFSADDYIHSGAALLEPGRGSWSADRMSIGRAYHTATLLNNGTVLVAGGFDFWYDYHKDPGDTAEIFTPPALAPLPTSCVMSLAGTDPRTGQTFIRVAARDIASGLQSVKVLEATNATVTLPQFPPGSRDPAVVIATKIATSQPATVKLSVTNRAGMTVTCDPIMTTLLDQRNGNSHQTFSEITQAESKLQLTNNTPGLERVDVTVNGHRFRLDNLESGEERTLDVASAMQPGDHNTIEIKTHGPRNASALLLISE